MAQQSEVIPICVSHWRIPLGIYIALLLGCDTVALFVFLGGVTVAVPVDLLVIGLLFWRNVKALIVTRNLLVARAGWLAYLVLVYAYNAAYPPPERSSEGLPGTIHFTATDYRNFALVLLGYFLLSHAILIPLMIKAWKAEHKPFIAAAQ